MLPIENFNSGLLEILACPRCKGALEAALPFECKSCGLQFPIVGGVPVFLNEANSLFEFKDFTQQRDTTYNTSVPKWKRFAKKFIPSISLNIKAPRNFQNFLARLGAENSRPCLLVVGGAVAGQGFDAAAMPKEMLLVETDVAFGERTDLICDAHDLPFQSATFDGVIIQAVLEHVLDPFACVAEIHRVLKTGGAVYAETPFMQQVHAGRFDFMRFTHLGHRRLFRSFEEIESGAVCGAGMALAWSYCYFLSSFFTNRTLQQIAFAFGSLTSFWLKYFDYFLIDRPGSYDAASSFYFWGRKAEEFLPDKKLIAEYKGAIQ